MVENPTLPWTLRWQQTRINGTRKFPSLFFKEKWRHGVILHPNNYFPCIALPISYNTIKKHFKIFILLFLYQRICFGLFGA